MLVGPLSRAHSSDGFRLTRGMESGGCCVLDRKQLEICCDSLESAREIADRSGLTNRIDWRLAERVLEARDGVAREVSRQPAARETGAEPE